MKKSGWHTMTYLMRRILDGSQRCLELLLVLLSVAMVILVFAQVIFRYVFFYSISWSEELATFVFVWIVLLGAAVGVRKEEHLGIGIFVRRMPKGAADILEIVTRLLVILFFGVVLWFGWEVAMANMVRRAYTVNLPVGYVRMSLPIMALFSVLYGIESEIRLLGRVLRRRLEPGRPSTNEDIPA